MNPITRREVSGALATVGTMALTGCASPFDDASAGVGIDHGDWPMAGHDSHNTGFNPDASPITARPAVAWRSEFTVGDVPSGLALLPRPAVVEDAVYVGGRTLTAHALDDGAVDWERDVSAPVFGAAGDGEQLYLPTWTEYGDAALAAFDASSGERQWRVGSDWSYAGPPVVRDGAAFLPTKDALVAVAADGTRRWSLPMHNRLAARPAITTDGLYHLTRDREVAKYPTGGNPPSATWTADSRWGVLAAPAVSDDGIFVGESITWPPQESENDAQVTALDADGSERWAETVGARTASPAVADGVVYALAGYQQEEVRRGDYAEIRRDGVVRAFDAADGTERWRQAYEGYGNALVDPVVAGDVCYVALNDTVEDRHRRVARQDGTERWEMEFPEAVYHLAAVGETLLAAVADGTVRALR
jgi:outer membrane protein assembly factor BamB